MVSSVSLIHHFQILIYLSSLHLTKPELILYDEESDKIKGNSVLKVFAVLLFFAGLVPFDPIVQDQLCIQLGLVN